jgi:hypothetical protein
VSVPQQEAPTRIAGVFRYGREQLAGFRVCQRPQRQLVARSSMTAILAAQRQNFQPPS